MTGRHPSGSRGLETRHGVPAAVALASLCSLLAGCGPHEFEEEDCSDPLSDQSIGADGTFTLPPGGSDEKTYLVTVSGLPEERERERMTVAGLLSRLDGYYEGGQPEHAELPEVEQSVSLGDGTDQGFVSEFGCLSDGTCCEPGEDPCQFPIVVAASRSDNLFPEARFDFTVDVRFEQGSCSDPAHLELSMVEIDP